MENKRYNKLEEGMIFNNYKKLCEFIGWKVTTGDSKKAQFKELLRYCRYRKEGNKIIIDTKYKNIKDVVDMRKNGNNANNIRVNIGNVLALEILLGKNKYHIDNGLYVASKTSLLVKSGIVGLGYSTCIQKPMKTSKFLNVDYDIMQEFVHLNHKTLLNSLESGLKYLRSCRLIDFMDTRVISLIDTSNIEIHTQQVNELDIESDTIQKITTKSTEIVRIASIEEEKLILKCEKDVLNDMGYVNIQSVFACNNSKKYYDLVAKKVRQYIGNYNYSFKAYKIIYDYGNLLKHVQQFVIDTEQDKDLINDFISIQQNYINISVMKKVDQNTINRYNESIKNPNSTKKIRMKDNYCDDNHAINYNVVNKDKNISVCVKKTVVTEDDVQQLDIFQSNKLLSLQNEIDDLSIGNLDKILEDLL